MTSPDMQSLHRVRERWVMRRTAVVNQIRGLLSERAITEWRSHIGSPPCKEHLRRDADKFVTKL